MTRRTFTDAARTPGQLAAATAGIAALTEPSATFNNKHATTTEFR